MFSSLHELLLMCWDGMEEGEMFWRIENVKSPYVKASTMRNELIN